MSANKELLTYCGFYCGDCLGYTGAIADAAQNLREVLDKYKFGRTAECIFPDELRDYDKFCELLSFMSGLRCPGRCRQTDEGTALSTCKVRDCCIDKGFYACYECDDLETCGKLRSLHDGLHTEACLKNMMDIREMGLEAWLARGERHCYWDEENDTVS